MQKNDQRRIEKSKKVHKTFNGLFVCTCDCIGDNNKPLNVLAHIYILKDNYLGRLCSVPMFAMKPKCTMLVVDDDRAILRVFKRILEKNGYAVVTAETGKEATEHLRNQTYDAALVDLKLADMEGTDLLPHMHQTAPNMMKIVISGMPYVESAEHATEAGADIFLEKPVKPEILLDVLEKGLRAKASTLRA